jgi:glycosyltransferase involved in cell wall biosynthesis
VHPAASSPQVVHIATRYLRGGSERRIRDIVSAFPEARHHVVVGADSDPALVRSELDPASLTIVAPLVRDPDPVKDLRALGRLTSLLRRLPADLVVTHQSKAGVLGRTAARWAGRGPVLHSLSMSSFGPGYPRWQDALFRAIEARLARVTSAYAVVGHDLARRYTAIGVPQDKLNVVRSGVPLPAIEAFDESARRAACGRHNLPADRTLLLYLGSLEARKNVLELPRFLATVRAARDDLRPFLAVAGDGPLAGELARRLERAGLGADSAMLGFVDEPAPLIAASDAVILLSSAEGIPQVLVQAAASGTPFVAFDVDGTRELLDEGAVGSIVPLGDVAAAARAAAGLLASGERAPAIDVKPWGQDEIAAGYRRLLGSLLGGTAVEAETGAASPPLGVRARDGERV